MASGSFDITIDATQIDSTLTNFPVMIYLSSSSGTGAFDATAIFDDLGANSKKIKVKNSSGTQLYCEIELWDDTGEKAVLHVKVDSISSSADTELSLEWDSTWADNTTYIGETGDTAAESVWDSNFTAVYHMNQDPSGGAGCILDSTRNSNDMSTAGSMTSGDLVDATYGKAIDFDGANDYFTISKLLIPEQTYLYSQSFRFKTSKTSDQQHFFAQWVLTGHLNHIFELSSDGYPGVDEYPPSGGSIRVSINVADGNWHQADIVRNGTSVKLYVDGALEANSSAGETYTGDTPTVTRIGFSHVSGRFFDGQVAHTSISDTNRSDAWVKATNESLTDNLLSLATGSGPVEDAEVSASAATEVNSRSAILQGSLDDMAGNASLSVYFEYGLTTEYGQTTNALTMTSTGSFSARPTNLTEETEYHFRACATDGVTVWTSDDQTLTTLACPFVLTAAPSITSILWDWVGVGYELELTIINPGAETGDTTGWTDESGTGLVVNAGGEGDPPLPAPYEGAYFFGGDWGDTYVAYQEIDIVDQGVPVSLIDAERLFFEFWGKQATRNKKDLDQGQLLIRFKDSSKDLISEHGSGLSAPTPAGTWQDVSVCRAIPAGTRYVDLVMEGYGPLTGVVDGVFDALKAKVSTEACS